MLSNILDLYPSVNSETHYRVSRYFLMEGLYPVIEFYDFNMIAYSPIDDEWGKVEPEEILKDHRTPEVNKAEFEKMLAVYGARYPSLILSLHDRLHTKFLVKKLLPRAIIIHVFLVGLVFLLYWLAQNDYSFEYFIFILLFLSLNVTFFFFIQLKKFIDGYLENEKQITFLKGRINEELSEVLNGFVVNPIKRSSYIQGCFNHDLAEESAENFRNTPEYKKLMKRLLKNKSN